jgi:hypothetical protein
MRIIGSTFPAVRLDAARAFLSDAPQPPSSVIVAAARKAAESVRPALARRGNGAHCPSGAASRRAPRPSTRCPANLRP